MLKYRHIKHWLLDAYVTYDPMEAVEYQLFIWADFTAES
jgi:hypothetical protein